MTIKKYRIATIKLLVGLLLLGASRGYLSEHPAEKASLLSGVDVLSHRVQMRLASVSGQDTDALAQQYKLTRYMKEIRYTAAHTSGCDQEGDLIADIDATIHELNMTDATDAIAQGSIYRNKIRTRESRIQNNCTPQL